MLQATIDYARRNNCDSLYLEVLPSKEVVLNWLPKFGFTVLVNASTRRGEAVMAKRLAASSDSIRLGPLGHNIAYGPKAVIVNSAHVIPIQPRFHSRLFPESERQHPLFPRTEACGNAIRKAYLSNANTRKLREGDTIVFIRTGGIARATAIGVVEETRASRNLEELVAFVGNRTVYSIDEIRELCEKRETLAILFRFDRSLAPPWTMSEMIRSKVLRKSPQSIQQVSREGTEWIRLQLAE
jgi:hypothetical protein